MTTIADLCFNQTPALADQIPLYGSSSGVTQRTSLNLLIAVIAQLPTVQPVTGSGQVWLNNGVVTVA